MGTLYAFLSSIPLELNRCYGLAACSRHNDTNYVHHVLFDTIPQASVGHIQDNESRLVYFGYKGLNGRKVQRRYERDSSIRALNSLNTRRDETFCPQESNFK